MSLPIPFDNPATYPGHTGVDFPQPLGTPIRASGPGVVGLLSRNANGGYITWIDYDGGPGVGYAHQDKHSIAKGARVDEGTRIGYVGNSGRSTGPHLHIEIADQPGDANVWRYFDSSRVVGDVARGGNQTSRPVSDIQTVVGAKVDGVYGPETTAKVSAWQSANGLQSDGAWGPLSDARAFPPVSTGPTVRRGDKGDAVSAVQDRLKSRYELYAGHLVVDGDFGPATEAVVKEFQRRAGLVDDGVVGPKTRAALGL